MDEWLIDLMLTGGWGDPADGKGSKRPLRRRPRSCCSQTLERGALLTGKGGEGKGRERSPVRRHSEHHTLS